MLVADDNAVHVANGNGTSHDATAAAQLDLIYAERRLSIDRGVGAAAELDVTLPTTIVKRDGREVPFDPMRIERALQRCFAALGRQPYTPPAELALRVVNIICARGG